MLKYALRYHELGFSVIPAKKDKRPLIKWEQYQKQRADVDQIRVWWDKWPDANIAIITGDISGVDVVDCDTEDAYANMNDNFLPDSFATPIVKTPKGYHVYFKHRPGLSNAVRVITGTDLRTEGGYVIAPPSQNGHGKKYSWLENLAPKNVSFSAMPEILFDVLKQGALYNNNNSSNNIISLGGVIGGGSDESQKATKSHKKPQLFTLGQRDDDLFRLANYLIKGGLDPVSVNDYLVFCANHCNPPFPENEVYKKIESAIKRASARERNIAQEVRDFVKATEGHFSATELHKELLNATKEEKKAARQEILRMIDEGIIERVGPKNGYYRKKSEEAEIIDIYNIEKSTLDIWYPLNLNSYFYTQPKNLIVFCGTPDVGKTAFLMRCAIMNAHKGYKIRYMSSEMGASEFASRASLFRDIEYSEWKHIDIRSVSKNYKDHIIPEAINIIDYLEITNDFYLVGDEMRGIYDALSTGIAIIGLQMSWQSDYGRGGAFSVEKPRLYVTLKSNPPEGGIAKIQKMKNWKTSTSMSYKECAFKIRSGNEIHRITEWGYGKEK